MHLVPPRSAGYLEFYVATTAKIDSNYFMPRKVDVDFELARSLYTQGLPMPAIAKKLNCSLSTLKSRAHREGWTKTLAKSDELLQTEPLSIEQQADRWRQCVAGISWRKMKHLESIAPEKLTMRDMKFLAETQRIYNEMARQTLKMDISDQAEHSRHNARYAVNITLPPGAPPIERHQPVIVETHRLTPPPAPPTDDA